MADINTLKLVAVDNANKIRALQDEAAKVTQTLIDAEAARAAAGQALSAATLALEELIAEAETATAATGAGLQDQINTKLNFADYTAEDILAKLITVDGAGTDLDADKLDGLGSSSFVRTDSGTQKVAGSFGVNTTPGGDFNNGSALAIGDSDTGIRQDGDGQLELWANNQEVAHVSAAEFKTVKKLNASNGITGLTLANGGITGSNFDITGVNQLTINDPGEGIKFTGTTDVRLFAIDDTTDSIMSFDGATKLIVNDDTVVTANNAQFTNDVLIKKTTNSGGVGITFDDHLSGDQSGAFRGHHGDTDGGVSTGYTFKFSSTEPSTAVKLEATGGNSGFYVGSSKVATEDYVDTNKGGGSALLTTSGTWNWENAGFPDSVTVYAQGGGAGGIYHPYGSGGGGGAGGYSLGNATVSGNVAYTVGQGGEWGEFNNLSSNGGTTKFGSISAAGGLATSGGVGNFANGGAGTSNTGYTEKPGTSWNTGSKYSGDGGVIKQNGFKGFLLIIW